MGKNIKKVTKENYKDFVSVKSRKTKMGKNMLLAFLIGGVICTIGQAISDFYLKGLGFNELNAAVLTSMTLVFLASLFTGLGLYDNIAVYGGAGTLVPITGFSNAITSAAMEFKAEGMILGVGAKMFTIAGPVIAYGVLASIIYGVVYYITTFL